MFKFVLVFLLLATSPLVAHADCRFESMSRFKTAGEAQDRIMARTGKRYTCLPSTDAKGQSVWGCESGAGDHGRQCEMLANFTRTPMWGERSIYPDGEGAYESWPSGQRYRCDRAFGCRPSRGGN